MFRKKKQEKQIKEIRLFFDYGSDNIFFYDTDGFMMTWDSSYFHSSYFPPDWEEDAKFMSLNKQINETYTSLFIDNEHEFTYVGFKDAKQKIEFKKLVDEFVKYVETKAAGEYEIVNNYDVDEL